MKLNKFNTIDNLLKSGGLYRARQELKKINIAQLKRKQRLELSTLARRSQNPKMGILLLRKYVRGDLKIPGNPTSEELIEYAHCLTSLNITTEAYEILGKINMDKYPACYMSIISILFKKWQHKDGIIPLQKYISHPFITNYQRLIGKTNLAAAFVNEKINNNTENFIKDIILEAESKSYTFALSYLYELLAEWSINEENWNSAKLAIKESENFCAKDDPVSMLYLKKLQVIYELSKSKENNKYIKITNHLKNEATRLKEWEIIRDLDYYIAVKTKNREIFNKLWFGTPYTYYKTKLENECPWVDKIPVTYHYKLGPSSNTKINISNGISSNSSNYLTKGQIPQKLLYILSSDFYRPQDLYSIHSQLFPDRHFNPISSPATIYQAMKRLRKFFKENQLPINISENSGQYKLNSSTGINIEFNTNSNTPSPQILEFSRTIKRHFNDSYFQAQDIADFLKTSKRTALTWLNRAINYNLVIKCGKTARTRYAAI